MIDLINFYIAESSLLKLFLITLIPIVIAPLGILVLTRYIYQWYDPKFKMTPANLFIFVTLATLITVAIIYVILYFAMPPGTDITWAMFGALAVFGLFGAGRLYLVDPSDKNKF